jgi:hypothetical protein
MATSERRDATPRSGRDPRSVQSLFPAPSSIPPSAQRAHSQGGRTLARGRPARQGPERGTDSGRTRVRTGSHGSAGRLGRWRLGVDAGFDGGSRGSDGTVGRRLGGQPERAEQAPPGVGLGHRAHNPARPGTAGTDIPLAHPAADRHESRCSHTEQRSGWSASPCATCPFDFAPRTRKPSLEDRSRQCGMPYAALRCERAEDFKVLKRIRALATRFPSVRARAALADAPGKKEWPFARWPRSTRGGQRDILRPGMRDGQERPRRSSKAGQHARPAWCSHHGSTNREGGRSEVS